MRVKIPTADLIEAVEKRKKAALKSYEKELAKYTAARKAAEPKLVAALREAADDLAEEGSEAKSLKFNFYRESGVEIEVPTNVKLGESPRPTEMSSLDYALSALKRTTDKTISLTPEELAWYTGDPENG